MCHSNYSKGGEINRDEEVPEVITDIEQTVTGTDCERLDSADRSNNVLDNLDIRPDQRSAVGFDSTLEITENDDVNQCEDKGQARPRRERRQNVRYKPEVYDLSTVTQRRFNRR